ncbi:MAG: MFS transporter [Nocardiaceae bacterium]|nr:MFS transporter [Nocardiaceae bacterium]
MANRSAIELGAAAACAALMPLNSTMIAVAIPDIAQDLGGTAASATQILVSAYLVTAIVLQSPGGKLGDRIGHWELLRIGQIAVLAGAIVGWFAPNIEVLGLARILMAVGGAALVPATFALMRLELAPEHRATAFGRMGAAMALAAALGPLVGGELSSLFGWRSLFLANFPIVVAAALVIFLVQRQRPKQDVLEHPRFDFPGTITLGAGLCLMVIGLQSEGWRGLAMLAGSVIIFVGFWQAEQRAADPVIDFSLFRRPAFSAGSAVIALQNLAMYSLIFQLPIVVHVVLRMKEDTAGRLLITMILPMVLVSLVSGRVSRAVGPRLAVVIGAALGFAGVALLWTLGPGTNVLEIAIPLAIAGAGFGLSAGPAQAAAQAAAPGKQAGMAAGATSTLRYLGGVIGIAILGLFLNDTAGPVAVLNDHRILLGFYCASVVLSGLSALALPAKAPEPVSPTRVPSNERAPEGRSA